MKLAQGHSKKTPSFQQKPLDVLIKTHNKQAKEVRENMQKEEETEHEIHRKILYEHRRKTKQ